MNLGILGLSASGKTTIFNALTGATLPTGTLSGGGRLEVNSASVDVPDHRLEALVPLFNPRKSTSVKVNYADIGGMSIGAGSQGLPGPLVNELVKMDGLLVVVRAFDDPQVPHPAESVDPKRDAQALATELLLHDLVTVDRRLAAFREARGKGGEDREKLDRQIALFERLNQFLNDEIPLRRAELRDDELISLAGFGLLSTIPQLVVVNLAEGQDLSTLDMGDLQDPTLGLQGKLEMEIAQLSPDEGAMFLEEYDLSEPGRARAIQASFELLGLISFFTGNEQEVRAWTLPDGGTCLKAAETIHSDLARGFIRAEVIHWDELVKLGGMSEARAAGRMRIEGKHGQVKDGDLVYIRFNV